jgi:hypothetical protein
MARSRTNGNALQQTNAVKPAPQAKFASNHDAKHDKQIVQIIYQTLSGDEAEGPKISYARLRRFSKRARRELRGSKTWIVRCNHYQQQDFFNALFIWFNNLDDDVRTAYQYTGMDSAKKYPEIDKNNEWIVNLSWKGMLLLDHSADYLHLREPLDNRKTRTMLFEYLDPTAFAQVPLPAVDLHLAYFLLQFKSKWLQEARLDPDEMIKPKEHTNGESTTVTKKKSKSGTPSSLDNNFTTFFNGFEERNKSLIAAMVRRTAQWLLDDGDDALLAYVAQLEQEAKECDDHEEENNGPLIAALSAAYDWYKERRLSHPKRKY